MRIIGTYDWRQLARNNPTDGWETVCHQKVPERFRNPHRFLHHHLSSLRRLCTCHRNFSSSANKNSHSSTNCVEQYCIDLALMHADQISLF